jgi:hypothetical protein
MALPEHGMARGDEPSVMSSTSPLSPKHLSVLAHAMVRCRSEGTEQLPCILHQSTKKEDVLRKLPRRGAALCFGHGSGPGVRAAGFDSMHSDRVRC